MVSCIYLLCCSLPVDLLRALRVCVMNDYEIYFHRPAWALQQHQHHSTVEPSGTTVRSLVSHPGLVLALTPVSSNHQLPMDGTVSISYRIGTNWLPGRPWTRC
mgnify:CR=1 FL=1